MKTARQQQEKTNVASATSKVGTSISSTKAGKYNTKATRQIRKMAGKNNKDSIGKFAQPLSSPPKHLHHAQVMAAGSLKMAIEFPTLESGQILKPFEKFKLQLFPIDEVTRKELQKNEQNPYLELTLRPRKKISSVVKHLNIKWGNSRIALGELMLFPYEARLEDLPVHRKWTLKDTDTSAADVYSAIGHPAVFRLRYGWFSNLEPKTSGTPCTSLGSEGTICFKEHQNIESTDEEKQLCLVANQELGPVSVGDTLHPSVCKDLPLDKSVEAVGNLRMGNCPLLSWADCLTNTSIGDLLSEASPTPDANCCNQLNVESNSSLKQIPFSCDSFDAAIAAFIARNRGPDQSMQVSHSSIWDAEETCHAFPFQKTSSSGKEVSASCENTPASCSQNPSSIHISDMIKVGVQVVNAHDHASEEPTAELQPHTQDDAYQELTKHFLPEPQVQDNDTNNLGMTHIYWSNSLEPFGFDILSKQIIGGDSISLSGLIASSLDAFQNCSFFGTDKKAPST